MRKVSFILFIIVLSCFSFAERKKKDILILSSYSQDYLWTRQVNEGIFQELSSRSEEYNFSIDYMDTKKYSSKSYIKSFDSLFSKKYKDRTVDLVIAIDDNAFNYAISKREEFFKKTPILGTGLNTFNPEYKNYSNIYQMIEEPDYEANIKLALKQNPNAEKIYFITDLTTTGQKIKEEVNEITKNYDFDFEWIDSVTLEEAKAKVKSATENEIIMYLVFFTDKLGRRYDYKTPIKEISAVSNKPIYINWSFYLNTGAYGGYTYNGKELGIQTILIADDILKNRYIGNVISTKQKNEYTFDYRVIKEKNIKIEYYPLGSIFLNKPLDFFKENKEFVIFSATAFITLIIISILMLLNLRKQKMIIKKDKELLDTQKELLLRLGNVIESRSKETATHVNRVAKISRYLAEKMGFDEAAADLIEIASPLHDVGKIGISDEILNFPGKYNQVQFENMKKHAGIGYSILKGSGKDVIETAARIAFEHHERWDGTGYPRRLSGEQIHPFARITMIADVMDALLHERPYKEAWSFSKTIDYLIEEKGRMFDPNIIDIILENQNEIINIISNH